jgi:hypothetical protein
MSRFHHPPPGFAAGNPFFPSFFLPAPFYMGNETPGARRSRKKQKIFPLYLNLTSVFRSLCGLNSYSPFFPLFAFRAFVVPHSRVSALLTARKKRNRVSPR